MIRIGPKMGQFLDPVKHAVVIGKVHKDEDMAALKPDPNSTFARSAQPEANHC